MIKEIQYKNLKFENSQDYAQKPYWNCTFMNSASEHHVIRPDLCWEEQQVLTSHDQVQSLL
jgi:hypothetical protein